MGRYERKSTFLPANCTFSAEKQDRFAGVHFHKLSPWSFFSGTLHLLVSSMTKGEIKNDDVNMPISSVFLSPKMDYRTDDDQYESKINLRRKTKSERVNY